MLEEIVVSSRGLLPSLATIGTNFEALDGLIGIDNLHGEPPLRGSALIMETNRRGDATSNELIRGLDDAVGATYCREGIGEEVEVTFVAFGALVNDL